MRIGSNWTVARNSHPEQLLSAYVSSCCRIFSPVSPPLLKTPQGAENIWALSNRLWYSRIASLLTFSPASSSIELGIEHGATYVSAHLSQPAVGILMMFWQDLL